MCTYILVAQAAWSAKQMSRHYITYHSRHPGWYSFFPGYPGQYLHFPGCGPGCATWIPHFSEEWIRHLRPDTKSQACMYWERAEPMAPNTKAALPCCRATDTCWRRKARALTSCVAVWICLPISANRSKGSVLKVPDVHHNGIKWWVQARISYLYTYL